jgi:hypothetical protein
MTKFAQATSDRTAFAKGAGILVGGGSSRWIGGQRRSRAAV